MNMRKPSSTIRGSTTSTGWFFLSTLASSALGVGTLATFMPIASDAPLPSVVSKGALMSVTSTPTHSSVLSYPSLLCISCELLAHFRLVGLLHYVQPSHHSIHFRHMPPSFSHLSPFLYDTHVPPLWCVPDSSCVWYATYNKASLWAPLLSLVFLDPETGVMLCPWC